jgi:hypothetical protein
LPFLVPTGELRAQENFYRPTLKPADIESFLHSDWYGLYFNGKKSGYIMRGYEKVDGNIVEKQDLSFKVTTLNKQAEMKGGQALTFEGKPPYRLMSGVFRLEDGANTVVVTATRAGDMKFDLVFEVAGQKRERKVDDLDYTLPDAMAGAMWLRTAPKDKATILGKELDLKEWKMDETKYLLLGAKSALVGNVKVKFYEVESESKKEMIKVLSRHDASGNFLQGTMGGIFEFRKETEAQAKDTQYSQDLFVLGQAKIDKEIGAPLDVAELVLEIEGKIGAVFENGPRQTITKERPGIYSIKLGKKYSNDIKATAKEIDENLEETNAYAIKDPKVIALAKKAVGDAKTPEEKVQRIVAFVRGYIKGDPVASLPNIHDLIEKKKGDCKSYALMTTNLCRAAGIPARDVSGLVYMGDDVKALGGHAWNEVVLNGVWVPVDASRGQAEIDAGHISFGTDQRANKIMLETIGKLSFKVVESRAQSK